MSKTLDKPCIQISHQKNTVDYWLEIFAYRELFFILAWRDVSVRYKQAILGILWAIIRPLLTMAILTLVFHKIAKIPQTESIPYPIFVFIAIIPWYFFSSAIADASNSLINNTNLITKIFFPRMIIPLSTILVSIIDLFLSIVVLLGLFIFYKYQPCIKIIFLPLFLIPLLLLTIGTSLLLCTLTTKYLDFRYVIPFIIQLSLYISPVGYDTSLTANQWKIIYSLNPIVGIIDGFRWCVTPDQYTLNMQSLSLSIVITTLILYFGIRSFKSYEKTMADSI